MPHHSGGGVCSLQEEKAVEAISDGFYFCCSIYRDDEGKTCMRTSELIEISSGTLPVFHFLSHVRICWVL